MTKNFSTSEDIELGDTGNAGHRNTNSELTALDQDIYSDNGEPLMEEMKEAKKSKKKSIWELAEQSENDSSYRSTFNPFYN